MWLSEDVLTVLAESAATSFNNLGAEKTIIRDGMATLCTQSVGPVVSGIVTSIPSSQPKLYIDSS